MELSQESKIVLKEQTNVVDPVLEHGDTLHAHSEGEARNLFGIVADEAKDLRVDHSGTQDLQPPRTLTDATVPLGRR